jgi:hypothetical protein
VLRIVLEAWGWIGESKSHCFASRRKDVGTTGSDWSTCLDSNSCVPWTDTLCASSPTVTAVPSIAFLVLHWECFLLHRKSNLIAMTYLPTILQNF